MSIKPKQSRSESRAEKRHRYSIRKFNQGVASVAIGAFMFLGATGVAAEEVADVTVEAVEAVETAETPVLEEEPAQFAEVAQASQPEEVVVPVEEVSELFDQAVETEEHNILKNTTNDIANITKFVDEAGNEIAASQDGTVAPISIAGYVVISTGTRTSGDVVETTHTYHQLMTYWVDQSGNQLRDAAVGTFPDSDANDLAGYVLTNIRTSGGDTYNVYRPASQDDVTTTITKFVDEAGAEIAASQNGTVAAQTIAGYQQISSRQRTGVNGSVETTYVYHQIVTNWVDESGNVLKPAQVGELRDTEGDDIAGYAGVGIRQAENGDITNIYRQLTAEEIVDNVTKFIDEYGNTIADSVPGQVDPIAIEGYFAISTATRTRGDNTETTHTYHRIVTKWVDQAGTELKAPAFAYQPDNEGDDIEGYVLVSTDTLENSDVINTYRLAPETPKFTIEHETRFVDEAGQAVADSQAGTVAPIAIDGYFNISTSNRSQTIGDETRVETTHTYHQIVTNYVDEAGQTIQATKTGSFPSEAVSGYTLVRYSAANNGDVTNVYRLKTPEETVNNVTHFVDQAGTSIAADEAGKVAAKTIDGYVYVSTSTKSDEAGNAETTHVYRVETAEERVEHVTHFVDEAGATIAPDQAGTLNPIDISGYFNISTSSKTKGDNVETTHVYHQIVTNYVDQSGASIQATKTGSHPSEAVLGYVLVSSSTASNGDVTNVYRVETAEDKEVVEHVTHFVDEAGTTIAPDQAGTVDPIAIAGYFAVQTSSKTKGDNVETTHIYHQIVTNWVDEAGQSLKAQEVGAKPDNDDVSDIENYQLTSVKTETNGDVTNVYHQIITTFVDESGTSLKEAVVGAVSVATISGYDWARTTTAANGDVTHIYRLTPTFAIEHVTKFVDESGKELAPSQSGTVDAIEISGYTHKSSSNRSQTIGDETRVETTHVYQVAEPTQEFAIDNITKFVDESGKELSPSQSGTVDAIEISGYTLKSSSERTQTIGDETRVETTHVYQVAEPTLEFAIENITKFVDESGKELSPSQSGKVDAIAISGYEHKSSSERSQTIGDETRVETTHVYQVSETQPEFAIEHITKFVDESGKELSPSQSGTVNAIVISGYTHKSSSNRTQTIGDETRVETTHVYQVAEPTQEFAIEHVTKFVDESGKELSPSQSGTVDAIEISGYTLKSSSNRSQTIGDETRVETTHVYQVAESTPEFAIEHVTKFVDESGKELSPSQSGTVNAIEISGYTHKSSSNRSQTIGDETRVETTHVYQVAESTPEFAIEHVTKFVDESGKELSPSQSGTVDAIEISGYTLKSSSNRSQTIGDETRVETTYVYQVAESTPEFAIEHVTKFVDESGKELSPSQSGTVDAIEISGYTLKSSSNRSQTIGDETRVETTHVYQVAESTPEFAIENVTKFVDESGKELAPSQSGTVAAIEISGYTHKSSSNRSQTIGDETRVETTHVYQVAEPTQEFAIEHVTKFVDESGKELAPSQSGTVNAIEISGYTHKSSSNRSQSIGDETRVETTHVYQVAESTPEFAIDNITKFVDESGKELAPSQSGTVDAIEISGYTHKSSSNRSQTIGDETRVETTHVYQVVTAEEVVQNVTHFVDEAGTPVAADQEGSVEPLVIEGYFNISTSTKTQGDLVETTHVYHQIVTTYLDEAGQVIQAAKTGSYPSETIAGYSLVSSATAENGDVTNVYKLASTTDTEEVANQTRFVDESGKALAEAQAGLVDPISITGYVHISTSSKTKGDNTETTHVYRPATASETVVHVTHFVDENGKALQEDVTGTVEAGTISGYTYVSTSTKTDDAGNVETTHVYRVTSSASTDKETVPNVTRFIAADGSLVSEEEEGQVSAPRVIRTVDDTLYRYASTTSRTDVQGNVETTHHYVLVTSEEIVPNETKFVDESGQVIASSQNGQIEAPTIEGYVHQSTTTKTDIEGNTETTHTYHKIETVAVDENGQVLTPDANGNVSGYYVVETKTTENGDVTKTYKELEHQVLDADGQVLAKATGTTQVTVPSGYRVVSETTDSNGNTTITVEKVSSTVTYVDENGKVLTPDVNGNVPGYYVVETKTAENGDVTKTYKELEHQVLDADGQVLAKATGTTQVTVPSGYRVVSETTDSNGNTTITVEKIESTVTYVDENGQVLTSDANGQVPGYKLIDTKVDAQGNTIYVYGKETTPTPAVTTSHVDSEGNTLTPDVNGNVPGYKLVDTKVDAAGNTTHVYAKETSEPKQEVKTSKSKTEVIANQSGSATAEQAQVASKQAESSLPNTGETSDAALVGLGLASLLTASAMTYRRKEN